MNIPLRDRRISLNPATAIGIGLAFAAALAFLGFLLFGPQQRPAHVFGRTVEKAQMLSRMRVQLHAAVEAEKSAVLAETDEDSRLFAEQAANATAALEADRRELVPLVEADGPPNERELLKEFDGAWNAFRKIDKEILELAVQNTNLKASRLSHGPSQEAIRRLGSNLDALREANAKHPAERKIAKLSYQAQTAALGILSLHAPHIAEASEKRMDEIEREMRAAEAQAKAALEDLGVLVPAEARPSLDAAKAAYEDFSRSTQEVIRLSRQNTNVRSLALSLGQKRKTAARCEDLLAALQDSVEGTLFKGTR